MILTDRAAEEIEAALRGTLGPLEDWILTTGHGEVNRRDRKAFEAVKSALAFFEEPPVTTKET